MKLSRLIGFTLAEVLITLGIIGVIASLTIPTLMQKQKDMATISAVKKSMSVISNAFISAVQDEGPPTGWTLGNGGVTILDNLAPYLKISKNCGIRVGCFPTGSYKLLDRTTDDWNIDSDFDSGKAMLGDGSLIVTKTNGNCNDMIGTLSNICGTIWVDVNGFKTPNTKGLDLFGFYMTKDKIVPIGTGANNWDAPAFCNMYYCDAATLWIIYNNNMDYLSIEAPPAG